MSLINDTRFQALRALGFTGSTNDMLLQWLQANGATSPALPSAWLQYLELQLGEDYTGHRVDDRFKQLRDLGYTGSRSDMELQFWTALLPPT